MWLQLDTDLLDSPRWLNLSLPARLWYVSMLAHCIVTGSGYLDRSEWEATRAMRAKLALQPDEYPEATAAGLISELASEATHLVDLTDSEITVRGFEKRYTEICNRRSKDAARQRERRKKLKQASRVSHADVTRTSKNVTRTEGDVDVDVDGGAAERAPAPPSTGNGKATAGNAHVRLEGNGKGYGKRQRKLSLPQKKVDAILRVWRTQPNDFRCWNDLTDHVMANADEPIVLSHVLDVEKGALAVERKPRVLWSRLNPEPGTTVNLPSETAQMEAKQILNAEMEVIAGDFGADIGKSAKLKPAAVSKKGKK